MKIAIESYGGVKGCYAAVCQVQPSAQTMTKHTMTGVQASNNFSYENRGLRMWRAYGIGPGKFYSADQLARFGTPQDPTRLVTMETFSNPNIEVGSCLQRTQMSEPGSLRQLPKLSQTEEESKKFSCQEEGCIKVFQSFTVLRKHLDIGKHMLKLAKKTTYNEIKKKWIEAVHSVGGGYVHSQTSAKDSGEQSLVTQVDLGWALWKTQKAVAISQRAKNYLADMFWTGEETGKKATASDVASKMKSSRGDTGQKMFSKTDWLTKQIALYFSWLSVLTRTGLLQRSPAVSMTEEEEVDADELALEVTTDRTRQKIRRDLEL